MTCQKAHGGPPGLLRPSYGGPRERKEDCTKVTHFRGVLYIWLEFRRGSYMWKIMWSSYLYVCKNKLYFISLSSYGSTWSSMWLRFCCTMYTISIRDYSNIIWTQIFFIQEHMSMVNVNPPLKKNSKTIFKANLIDVWKECLTPYLSTWTSMWLHVFTQVQYVTSHENHK